MDTATASKVGSLIPSTPKDLLGWMDRHRGPFSFVLLRPGKKAIATEWLKGSVVREDMLDEAKALLTDPRDTITHINVWSRTEDQFVMTFRPEDFA